MSSMPSVTSVEDLYSKHILHLEHTLSSKALTAEEFAFKRFACCKLKVLSMWPLWESGEHD
jgi:hypothetical protein